MKKYYSYTVEGTARDGQTWKTTGTVVAEFAAAFNDAMLDSFKQLTSGRAVFGKPGIGCNGPYDIHRFTIEQVRQ
jgi:hypothetical protein